MSMIRTVGVIGAGRMGAPIIGHLARKGFTVLAYDVDAGKRDTVVRLIHLGAEVGAKNRRLETPQALALTYRHAEVLL